MRLVWVVIPLVLFSIIGIQESFEYGSGAKPDPRVCGDKLCSEIEKNELVMEEIDYESLSDFKNEGYNIFTFIEEDIQFSFPYQLTNGTIESMEFEAASLSLELQVNMDDRGIMSFILPRIILDVSDQGYPEEGHVLSNGIDTNREIAITSDYRLFTFDVKENVNKIEFVLGATLESDIIYKGLDPDFIFSKQVDEGNSEIREEEIEQCFTGKTKYSTGPIVSPSGGLPGLSLSYTITNGSIIDVKDPKSSLLLSINVCDDGFLTMPLKNSLVRSVSTNKNTCEITNAPFFVLRDGNEVSYEEIDSINNRRTLKIEITKDSQEIEIIGNDGLPSGIDELFRKSCWSPHEQIRNGFSVVCKDGLVTVFTPYEEGGRNTSACVAPSTAERLVERGWTKP